MSPVISFGIFTAIGSRALTTDTAFASLTLFALLASPLSQLIEATTQLMTAVGYIDRIGHYLIVESREEHRQSVTILPKEVVQEKVQATITIVQADGSFRQLSEMKALDPVITVRSGNAGWDRDKPRVLHNLNIEIRRSNFTFIVSPVGSGKSTLLHAFLGETTTFDGSLEVGYSQVAYCGQTPWTTNGTVQENILGMSLFNQPWYDAVVRACALEHDLQHFPSGDRTLLGSKGNNLSGGQRQRIALARALYSRADVIVLDDILSGLDATTENYILNELFSKEGFFRQARTTIILVTNSIERLSHADHVIVLGKDGTVVQQGKFEDLNATPGYVHSFSIKQQQRMSSSKESSTEMLSTVLSTSPTESAADNESRRVGDMTVYKYYFSFIGWKDSLVFVVLTLWPVFCLSFPSVWVMLWAKANEAYPHPDSALYIGIYAMLGVLAILGIVFLCGHLMVNMVPKTSGTLHKILLQTTLGAPMSFFSTTDTGITLNRFSQDLQLIDMELPIALLNTAIASILCLAQIILVSISARYIAAAIPFCLIVFYVIQSLYLRTSRQIRLLDIEAKSPLFSHFLETLNGLATVRAFGWENEHNALLDLSFAGLAVLLITIAVTTRGKLSGGFIGVALVNIVSFSTSLKDLITYWTILETSIGAVSRVRSFASETESENRLDENVIPDFHWPARGSIEIRDISASYAHSSVKVLKNVSLSIQAGQKIGVCGRSGSGKSSLVSTIFRMLELESGSIFIDDVDISTVPRQEIRSRLVAISQEPYLLSGTVRLNVDPFQTAGDDDVIAALETVRLWDVISARGGLDILISEDLLSHGQRQLISLARAMLRKGTILVLDEATSSVDKKTDELLQQIIRTYFAQYTVIAIAHRLNTILDFDKIVVVDKGSVLEFDSPASLLSRQSAFRELYKSLTDEEDGQDSDVSSSLCSSEEICQKEDWK